jgi:hypothetical protein
MGDAEEECDPDSHARMTTMVLEPRPLEAKPARLLNGASPRPTASPSPQVVQTDMPVEICYYWRPKSFLPATGILAISTSPESDSVI